MTRFSSLTAVFIGLTASAASAETLTISWWGYNGDKLNANIIEPFKELCGCDVVFETGNNADRLGKLTARGGKGVDVIYLTDSYSQTGIENGIFQKIDRSRLSNISKLYEMAQDPQGGYGPAYTVGRAGIVYDSAKVEPITSWADLWRADLEGAVSLPGITTTAGPMIVMQAGAVAGVDPLSNSGPAFVKLDEIKSNVVKNYNTGSEMVNLFSTGEVSVSVAQDFALYSLRKAVPTIEWAALEDGDIATLNTVNIPVGAANTDLAYKFIDFILSTELQTKNGAEGVDAPVNTEVKLTPEQASIWTYGPEAIGKLNRMDYAAMNQHKAEWIDGWNEIFGY